MRFNCLSYLWIILWDFLTDAHSKFKPIIEYTLYCESTHVTNVHGGNFNITI